MRSTARVAIPFAAALFLAACGSRSTSDAGAGGAGGTTPDGGGADVTEPASLVGRAFAIEIPPDDAGHPWCNGDCTPATALVKAIDGSTMELVWGATGRVATVQLSGSGSTWLLDGTIQLGFLEETHVMCLNDTKLGPATFDFADRDGDGVADLRIDGHQVSMHCADDYTMSSSSEVSLVGRPTARLANAVVPAAPFEPVHGVAIDMDEPLDAAATASLVPQGGGAAIPLGPRTMGGYVVGFDTKTVLPLGGRYTVQIAGKDFAGAGTPNPASFDVLDDFGVLVQDGFESGSTAGIRGAAIVEELQGVPALHGTRMLYVAPGEPALLRLRRTANESSVVMDVRKLDQCFGAFGEGPIALDVAVVGGAHVQSGSIVLGADPTTVPAGDAGGGFQLGELQTVTVPLVDGGEDVLVYLLGASYYGAGCSRAGALLDDVALK